MPLCNHGGTTNTLKSPKALFSKETGRNMLCPWETLEMYITSWIGIGMDEIVKEIKWHTIRSI
jgi:hypothetical protein